MNPPQKNYYVLLIGINTYPGRISNLKGCIKDINNIEAFLEKWIYQQYPKASESQFAFKETISIRKLGPLNLLRLEDKEASYENIKAAFRSFLAKAKKHKTETGEEIEDVIWFHFSGHGTEAPSAKEFWELEPNQLDQSLLCYKERDAENFALLRDKEIAALLYETAYQDEQGQPKEPPHIVLSLDCCHSGSGSRDMNDEIVYRYTDFFSPQDLEESETDQPPLLRSYADGFYQKILDQKKQVEIPLVPHLLLSACDSTQLAADRPEGGIFTLSLLAALQSSPNKLTYSDLYLQSKIYVEQERGEDQSPCFDIYGNFNPYRRFLGNSSLRSADLYQISYHQDAWEINCGAIHGIPISIKQAIQIEVWEKGDIITKGEINSVGALESPIFIEEEELLDKQKLYQASIQFLPLPPEIVWIHGDQAGVELIKKYWDNSKNICLFEDARTLAHWEVAIKEGSYSLRETKNQKEIYTGSFQSETDARSLIDSLGKIAKWKRFKALHNEKSEILHREWASFEILVENRRRAPISLLTEKKPLLSVNSHNFEQIPEGEVAWFMPKWKVQNCDRVLFAYLFYLGEDFSINVYEAASVYRPEEHKGKTEVLLPLWKQPKAMGLAPHESESKLFFKLLISTEPITYQQFMQSGLSGDKHIDFFKAPLVVNDWGSLDMEIALFRT